MKSWKETVENRKERKEKKNYWEDGRRWQTTATEKGFYDNK